MGTSGAIVFQTEVTTVQAPRGGRDHREVLCPVTSSVGAEMRGGNWECQRILSKVCMR